jgi:hypothetical protein
VCHSISIPSSALATDCNPTSLWRITCQSQEVHPCPLVTPKSTPVIQNEWNIDQKYRDQALGLQWAINLKACVARHVPQQRQVRYHHFPSFVLKARPVTPNECNIEPDIRSKHRDQALGSQQVSNHQATLIQLQV